MLERNPDAADLTSPVKRSASIAFGLERIGLIAIRAPILSCIILLAMVIGAVFGIHRIKIDDSLSQLFRSDTKEYHQYEEVTKRFPSTEFDVLVVVEGKTLLERDNLEKLRDMVTDLQLIDGVRGLISLFSARQAPEPGKLPAALFPSELPKGADYDKFIETVKSNEIIRGKDLKRFYEVGGGLFSKHATVKALNGLSFSLEAGKTLAVVGESGCGKSTLARLVTMIEHPTEGELTINGAAADDDQNAGERRQDRQRLAEGLAEGGRGGAQRHEHRREAEDEEQRRHDHAGMQRPIVAAELVEAGAAHIGQIGRDEWQHAGAQEAEHPGAEHQRQRQSEHDLSSRRGFSALRRLCKAMTTKCNGPVNSSPPPKKAPGHPPRKRGSLFGARSGTMAN